MQDQKITEINASELTDKVTKLKSDGYRLVAISCTNKNGFEMSYSFDKEYDFITLRFTADDNTDVESIGKLYSYAFLYENEIHELFGVNIINMTVDFKDKLYRIGAKTPFGNNNGNDKGAI